MPIKEAASEEKTCRGVCWFTEEGQDYRKAVVNAGGLVSYSLISSANPSICLSITPADTWVASLKILYTLLADTPATCFMIHDRNILLLWPTCWLQSSEYCGTICQSHVHHTIKYFASPVDWIPTVSEYLRFIHQTNPYDTIQIFYPSTGLMFIMS